MDESVMATIWIAVAVLALVVLGLLISIKLFYRKVAQGQAMIIKRMGSSVKVSFNSAMVFPIIHTTEIMNIALKPLVIRRRGKDGLICGDNIRADVDITFFVKVNKIEEDVIKVSDIVGTQRASDDETMQDLFQAQFSEAVKTVGRQMEFSDLYTDRDGFRDRIKAMVGRELYGYTLDGVAIDYLEQTPMTELDAENILDAQGIRKITELTARESVSTNEHRRNEEREIKRQDVEAQESIFELERREEEAKIRQEREIETLRAREHAEVAKVRAEEHLKSESARIATEEQTGVLHENRLREIAVAEKNRERVIAVETERIEKDRVLEVVSRDREEELATIAKNKEVEGEKRDIAEVVRERIAVEKTVAEQEEAIKRLRAVEDAERQREATIISAEAEAQENLVKDIKAAEAAEQASKFKARERIAMAEAEQQAAEMDARAKVRQAEGEQALAAADGLAAVQVREAEADAIEKGGLAEAKAAEALGLAEAEASKAKGTTEAEVLREKLRNEAAGLTEKAAAMDALSNASREHEEFRLRLEMEKELRQAEIDARRSIAEEQAKVIATGLEGADISIVGGETQFFDRVAGAVSYGKAVDGFMENSTVAQSIAANWSNGSTSFSEDLKEVLSTVGSDEVKNLTVSAALTKLMQRDGSDSAVSGLLSKARELGVDDKPVIEMTR
ncbi:flotillin family protein [Salininema proteolyticum]|uniref:Flotillin family protein n=1 Tax=Salininema proteolyticum TaxID=1607685 RepID=A0ABV8TU27_9ACTN